MNTATIDGIIGGMPTGHGVATIEALFLNGPTWDGNLISKEARDDLVRRGYVARDFGFNWLTRAGVMFAVKILGEFTDIVDVKRATKAHPTDNASAAPSEEVKL